MHKIIPVLIVIVIAVIFHLQLSDIPDTDSFYHIRHAWIYRTEGLFQNAFPWVQYSVINKFSADIWYGFHVLITPLTYFKNLITGIKLGGFLTTILSALLFFWAFIRLRVKWPLFWLPLLLLASADVLYRLTMLRPHPFSLGLALLLFTYLLHTKSGKKIFLPIFLISVAFSWMHLSLSWLPVFIVAVISGVQLVQKQFPQWKNISAVGAGLVLGWLLRPNPFGAIKIAYIQVVQLFLEKDIPLGFGRELTPFVLENFTDQLIPIFTLFAIGIGFLIWLIIRKGRWTLPPNIKTAVWSSLILSSVFFYLAFSVARRSNEIFVGFAVIFISLLFTHYYIVSKEKRRAIFSSWQSGAIVIVIVTALIYMPLKTAYRFNTYTANAFNPNYFKEAALWLKENSQPEEIVFNIHWDRFGQLFFWNQNNYYINGMDPIFQYAYNPSSYWKTRFLAIDQATAFTCGKIRCAQEEVENTHLILKRDFKASYIIIEKLRSPKLYNYLETADEFVKVF